MYPYSSTRNDRWCKCITVYQQFCQSVVAVSEYAFLQLHMFATFTQVGNDDDEGESDAVVAEVTDVEAEEDVKCVYVRRDDLYVTARGDDGDENGVSGDEDNCNDDDNGESDCDVKDHIENSDNCDDIIGVNIDHNNRINFNNDKNDTNDNIYDGSDNYNNSTFDYNSNDVINRNYSYNFIHFNDIMNENLGNRCMDTVSGESDISDANEFIRKVDISLLSTLCVHYIYSFVIVFFVDSE
ncbi:hypothetical protein EWB00_002062 [Schistosoma japonicum]|uniref:Uncharacterized protein n=1 Tax=Schistosoma japonicum TaxID=6182 RepID=A0A4Z2DDS9_SCHJA|nr:hypothetical protein EWB00_002062 [Schistosoma japonicum]